MITLELTPNEISALEALEEGEQIEVEYRGLPCFIVYAPFYGDVEINRRKYTLGFYNPPEWNIKVSPLVNVTLHVYFDDEGYQVRKFSTYKCAVKRAVRRVLLENFPEASSYRYTIADQKGG